MGLFCVNLHFKTTDDKALAAALNQRSVTRYRVVPAKGGWTSLYEEQASRQDDDRIRELAGGLSADLHVATVAFMVHDSDIACYWLFDDGRLLDEYHSDPNYFDDEADGPPNPSGGRPDILVRYCRTGVQEEKLTEILHAEALFAEDVIAKLAQALGIDRNRALADYRDGGQTPDGGDRPDGGDDDDAGGGPGDAPRRPVLTSPLAQLLGVGPPAASADPRALALVQAAAGDDTEEMARLLAAGVAVDSEAPAPFPGGELLAGLGQLLPSGAPKIAMTPLLPPSSIGDTGQSSGCLKEGQIQTASMRSSARPCMLPLVPGRSNCSSDSSTTEAT
jgi:hypothetical protein